MKGKYITTSLLLAILGNGNNTGLEVAETTARTEGHELIWTKAASDATQQLLQKTGKDELKKA